MNGHQEAGRERNDHAMQHIETEQRRGPDGPPAYEREAGIIARMDKSYVP